MDKKARAKEVIRRLGGVYGNPRIALDFSDQLEILVATILSAQCTDSQVNKVTPHLFKKYKTARDYAKADLETFQQEIKSTGFYRNKARNIIAACRMIVDEFHGEVPKTMEELTQLPGVARKTANIVLANGYGIVVGIAVDTHVGRLSQRLGLSANKDPNKIEQDLLAIIPEADWYRVNYLLIDHGRAICDARKPRCGECVLSDICPSAFTF
ncbi:MAG: endonuclease III [Candidatus Altiarchaeota archaeon]|nr:endonuclease III [Candidatus Altiarchaeota archaeon]